MTIIEANAIARVEKNNNNKNGIFNLYLTAYYNKNSQIPSFVDELVEGAIYEISGKVNLTKFSKTNEIK
ncbi:16071_t:CDS:2, partial [Entrophospora sp. SA101]